jgi:hypothetical protein
MGIVGRTAVIATVISALHASGTASAAPACTTRGGQGTGIVEGFAVFMAEAAMKNSAQAWGGSAVKIGKKSQKCTQAGIVITCVVRARVCK